MQLSQANTTAYSCLFAVAGTESGDIDRHYDTSDRFRRMPVVLAGLARRLASLGLRARGRRTVRVLNSGCD